MSDPDVFHRGVELDQLQVWRDADTGNVVFQCPPGRDQIVMTPEQWDRAVDFLNADCTCLETAEARCPIHDRVVT